MKEIRAIIRPSQLEKLRHALRALPDFPGLTVLKGEGFTAPSKVTKRTDAEELTDYSPKLLVCCIAEDLAVSAIQRIIIEQCQTGQTGDGLVWTLQIGSATKIKDSSPLVD
jgi:nitrogen regulatory protein P-II 1